MFKFQKKKRLLIILVYNILHLAFEIRLYYLVRVIITPTTETELHSRKPTHQNTNLRRYGVGD